MIEVSTAFTFTNAKKINSKLKELTNARFA
jgi:hypothetical protein